MKKTLIAILLFAVISCNLQNDKDLSKKIYNEIKTTKQLDLKKINDFEWDAILILEPYSDPQKIGKDTDVDLSDVGGNIKSSDDYSLLVFLKDKKAVKTCEVKTEFNFNKIYSAIIPREMAEFKLTADNHRMRLK